MKLNIIDRNKEKKGIFELPIQFMEDIRLDVIRRAVEVEQSNKRQPYGSSPEAGTRHSAYVSKRRHKYKSTYGIGQSRTPRKVISRHGARMNWVGAFAPQTVGGRQSHPPKAEKIWKKIMSKKERNFAIRSAMAASISKEFIEKRGHMAPESYPFILDSSIESLSKTKEVVEYLESIGLGKELDRTKIKKIRNGIGKLRGRKYKRKKGPLIVTAEDCKLIGAGANIPGVEVVKVDDFRVEILAPGGVPGRMALWTEKAIKRIEQEKLFM